MTPLLRAEWTRLFSRRVTLVTLVLIATLLAFLTFGFTLTRSNPTSEEIRTAGERAEAAAVIYDRNVALCEAVQSGTETAPAGVDFPRGCDYGARPTADSLLEFGFSFARQWPQLYTTAAIVLTVAGFVLGASFVGVEWSSGGMLNLLLWAPRRGGGAGQQTDRRLRRDRPGVGGVPGCLDRRVHGGRRPRRLGQRDDVRGLDRRC